MLRNLLNVAQSAQCCAMLLIVTFVNKWTRGHNVVAEGWAWASHPQPHPNHTPNTPPTFSHRDNTSRSILNTRLSRFQLKRKLVMYPDWAKKRPDCVSACIEFGAKHVRDRWTIRKMKWQSTKEALQKHFLIIYLSLSFELRTRSSIRCILRMSVRRLVRDCPSIRP